MVRAGILPPDVPSVRKKTRAIKKVVSFVNSSDQHSITATYVGTSGEMSFTGALMVFESINGALMQGDLDEDYLLSLRQDRVRQLLR